MPVAAGTNASRPIPAAISIDGIKSDQTEAATITPAAAVAITTENFLLQLLDHGAGIIENEAERAHDNEARHRHADGREGHEAVQEHAPEALAQ